MDLVEDMLYYVNVQGNLLRYNLNDMEYTSETIISNIEEFCSLRISKVNHEIWTLTSEGVIQEATMNLEKGDSSVTKDRLDLKNKGNASDFFSCIGCTQKHLVVASMNTETFRNIYYMIELSSLKVKDTKKVEVEKFSKIE